MTPKTTFRWEQDDAGGEHGMATYFVGTPNEVSLRIDTFADANKLDRAISYSLDQHRKDSTMTTDTQLGPTDDEIHAVVQACRERGLREFDVFRAVLDKWGQPAPRGVPVAWKHDCAAQP